LLRQALEVLVRNRLGRDRQLAPAGQLAAVAFQRFGGDHGLFDLHFFQHHAQHVRHSRDARRERQVDAARAGGDG